MRCSRGYIARAPARHHDAHGRRRSHEPLACSTSLPPLQAARGLVLHGLKPLPPLRRAVMRRGACTADRAAEPDAAAPRLAVGRGLDAQCAHLPEVRRTLALRVRTNTGRAASGRALRHLAPSRPALPARISGLAPLDRLRAPGRRSTWRGDLGQGLAPDRAAQPRGTSARSPISSAPFPTRRAEERERIALAAWENLGRVMVETMNIDRILKEPDRLHVTNGHCHRAATRTRWGRCSSSPCIWAIGNSACGRSCLPACVPPASTGW